MRINLYDGKYSVENNNGILTVYRNGEIWDRRDLIGDGFVLALVQEIEKLKEDLQHEYESQVGSSL